MSRTDSSIPSRGGISDRLAQEQRDGRQGGVVSEEAQADVLEQAAIDEPLGVEALDAAVAT